MINDLCSVCGGALESAGQHDAGPFCGCTITRTRVAVTVTKSPYQEDLDTRPPPWHYTERAFRDWVCEVFLGGHDHDERVPSLARAIKIVTTAGYEVEVSS